MIRNPMLADLDPDAIVELAGFVLKMWVVLAVLGIPAQALLVLGFKSEQKRRRIIAAIAAAGVVIVAAFVADVAYYPYDGNLFHSLVLWGTLAAFSVPAQLLLFFGIFRLKRIFTRLTALAGGAALLGLGVLAFGFRTIGYSLQHSLGGWP